MNKELIDQLFKDAEELRIDEDGIECLVFNKYKFANLIIKECAKIADDNYDKGFCPVGGFIKEHFGVE